MKMFIEIPKGIFIPEISYIPYNPIKFIMNGKICCLKWRLDFNLIAKNIFQNNIIFQNTYFFLIFPCLVPISCPLRPFPSSSL